MSVFREIKLLLPHRDTQNNNLKIIATEENYPIVFFQLLNHRLSVLFWSCFR